MRMAIQQQRRLDCPAVTEVVLNTGCRSEIVPVLRALQYFYSRTEVRDSILRAIGQDVNGQTSEKHGRSGLDYWSILVLAAMRLGCNFDYDQLQDLAENHRKLRQIMGIGDWEDEPTFDWRRIRDNVCRLRPETIEQINRAIVAEGHQFAPEAVESVRADSFVVETNIHYPTESTLIRDGLEKTLDLGAELAEQMHVKGWRQHAHLANRAKQMARDIDRIAARKGKNYRPRVERGYRELLNLAETVLQRADKLQDTLENQGFAGIEAEGLRGELATFMQRTRQVCDTARRRVLEGETVPNCDKLFSMFEPHTQLYKRGKAGQPMQFGRQALVYEDAAGFILDYYLLPRDKDDQDVILQRTRQLQKRMDDRIRRLSLDRGFHTPENQTALAELIPQLCLPMPGAKQSARQNEEASVEFRQAKKRHPGVESAIGALQSGNGQKRCRDRSEVGFERYLGLGILGRNLHTLGKLLIAREAPDSKAAFTKRKKAA